MSPPKICANAVKRAREAAYSAVLMDTAGRLHIDDAMMGEPEVRHVSGPPSLMLPWTAELCLDRIGRGALYEDGETDEP